LCHLSGEVFGVDVPPLFLERQPWHIDTESVMITERWTSFSRGQTPLAE